MKIILDFDRDSLTYTDSYLAALWHAAQWNSAPADDREACRTAEIIGREIIRRWLANTPPELWHRQGRHEESLPGMERAAKFNNVIEAARNVVDQDAGATIPEYREHLYNAIEQLKKELRTMEPVNGR